MSIEFGQRLKELRGKKDLTQAELAKLCNLGESTVSFYETGKREPNYQILLRLAEKLNTTPNYLLAGNGATQLKESPIIYSLNKVAIPVYGVIQAGDPIFADHDVIDYEYLPKDLVGEGENYFCLRVRGDSMRNARIADGDTVLVRKQRVVDNGAITVVLVNKEEATVKRFYQQNGQVILKPENEEYAPKIYDPKDVKILGEVVKAIINVGR